MFSKYFVYFSNKNIHKINKNIETYVLYHLQYNLIFKFNEQKLNLTYQTSDRKIKFNRNNLTHTERNEGFRDENLTF